MFLKSSFMHINKSSLTFNTKNLRLTKNTKNLKNDFFKYSKKNFFLANWKRSSRHHEDFDSSKGNTEDLVYYKQMKEFIKEAQGVPRYSQKWFELRNKHFRILDEKRQESREKFKESFDVQYLRFYVLLLPEQTDCYELVSLLNFYNIRYKGLEDSPVSKSILKQMLGLRSRIDHKKLAFPYLFFETSEDPTQTFEGFENIVQFLLANNFIHDYRSHTVYEKEGAKFIKIFEDCFEKEMKKFANKFSFFFRTTNFKEARYWYHAHKDGYIYRNRLFSRIYRLGKSIMADFKFNMQKKKVKKTLFDENEQIIIESIKTWIQRLNNNPFHGGDCPDEADFKLYAIMRKYTTCRGINFMMKTLYNGTHKIFKDKESSADQTPFMKFDDWNSKMQMLCSRNSHYNIREVGYNYNRYMSEEVNETMRINKPNQSEHRAEDENGSIKSEIKVEQNNFKNSLAGNRGSIMGVFGNKNKRTKVNF
jgi:hypothetical protein